MINKYLKNLTTSFFKASLSQKTLFLLIILLTFYKLFFTPIENPFCWDNLGYYLYLPKFFIYHDPYMARLHEWLYPIIEKYHNSPDLYQLNPIGDHFVIRYPIGQALFNAPFFFLAHLIAQFTSYPKDGFSLVYQVVVRWGSFLYLITGLFLLRKALLHIFDEKTTAVTLILLVFGTNLHLYAGTTSPHETLFFVYCAMLYITAKRTAYFSLSFWLTASALTGLACITRPTDVIIGFIPLLWGFKNLREIWQHIWLFLTKHTIKLFLTLLVFCAVLSIQMLYWKIFADKWIYYTYETTGERLYLTAPFTIDFLFSFRKGWFIYTPLMFVALFGFILMYRQRRDVFWSVFTFYILNLYLISSWTTWWYADSFSSRAMVQSLAVSIIPLGFLCQYIIQKRTIIKSLFFTLILLLFSLNLFQTWQFHKSIFPLDRLTRKAYQYIFLKTKIDFDKRESLMLSSDDLEETYIPNIKKYTEKGFTIYNYEDLIDDDIAPRLCDTLAYLGKHSLKIDSIHTFSNIFTAKYYQLTEKPYVLVKASAWVYMPETFEQNPFSFVIDFQNNGKKLKYKIAHIDMNSIKPKQWNYVEFLYLTPEIVSINDNLLVYFWLKGKKPIWIDNFRVDILEPI